jgi:hypothetical protein
LLAAGNICTPLNGGFKFIDCIVGLYVQIHDFATLELDEYSSSVVDVSNCMFAGIENKVHYREIGDCSLGDSLAVFE